MREIKFRLRLNNKMVGCEKWYSGSNKDGNWVAKPQWLYSANRKNWSPRYIFHNAKDLFTGLHDKNGKEIYEGDIVAYNKDYGGDKTFEVEYKKGGFTIQNALIGVCKQESLEVIGNIYENPELLEGDNAAD